MDKEQINELKPGDEVLIRGRFEKIKDNGDFQVSYLLTTVHGKFYMYKTAVHPSAVIIKSPPKHDPTRLFKNGDRAEVVERHGRTITCFPAGRIKEGDIVTVAENEAGDAFIKVLTEDGHKMMIPWFVLELITPVEELEPYYVERQGETSGGLCYTVRKPGGYVESTFYFGGCRSRDEQQAKAAAEAECDRLNAEYRKEAANG